jgi:hypothetical protein
MLSSSSRGHRGRGGGGHGHGPSGHRGRGQDRGRGQYRGRGQDDRGQYRGRGQDDRGRGRGRGSAPPINRTSASERKCTFYWSTGACNRGFECTFKHEARPGIQAPSPEGQPTDYTPDFFSPEGLAINNGSIVDSQHNLRPSEVHNHLKPYLLDNFVFRNAIHVEGFSRIFASVNARNRAWVRYITSMIQFFFDCDIGFGPSTGRLSVGVK